MTTGTQDANTFLMGAGGRSAKFEQHKDEIDGTVVSIELRQQTKYGTGELMTWEDGNPRMQMVVVLKITGDAVDEDDDLLRKVYIKNQMQQAVKNAVIKAGETNMEVGGRLFVRYVSDAEPSRPGMSGAKQFIAKYAPPDRSVAVPEGDPSLSGGPPDDYIDPDDLPFHHPPSLNS